jgi:Putative adhesin
MRLTAPWMALLAAVSLLSGCIFVGDWGDSDAFKQDFHSTHPLDAGGRISVESFNGSIDVTGWDQNSVEINGTKHAGFRDVLDDIKIDVNSTPSSIRIRAIRGADRFRNAGVRFSLRVPRKAILELLATSNGRIELDSVEGKARLHTSNGGMRLLRVKGDFEAETTNGPIDAQELRGNANFHTTNGSVHAEAGGGSFEAVTSNGRIEVRLTDPASGPVRLHSSNGHIELTLDSKQLPEVRANTTNSSILLRIPPMSDARVRANTSRSSSVTSEFGELRDDSDRRRRHSEMEGNIGHGGPLLELETTNGSIRIQKL